nr:hypothetical protein [Tanacetum cinerariifolium]
MSMIESNKEANRRYEASFAAHDTSFTALETHVDRLLEQLNRDKTYEPQGITMLDFDDEDEGEEQNEEFTLHSTNTMEWSAFSSCKDKEDADDHNNSFGDIISPITEHDEESVPFKVGEEVMEANTTPYLPTLEEPILSTIDDIQSKKDEEFFAPSLYDDKPRGPKEIVSENSNADIKSFFPSPIPIKDSDSHMEEIDLSLNPDEPNSRDFTKDVVEDISPTKEPQVLIVLPTHPTLQLNMKFQPSSESHFAYVLWIFLPFLVYSVVPCYLLSLQNEDIIFDPGICKSTFSKPDISHRCRTVKTFNTHRSHLNKCPMLINGQNNPPLDVLLFHFFPL